jgi:hypothetical protein
MERFNIATIIFVTGCTEGSISGWASERNIKTRDGLTVPQIMDFLRAPKRNRVKSAIDEKAAARLRTALEVMGAINKDFTLEG